MRPGLIAGTYPERGDQDGGWIDRCLRECQAIVARCIKDRPTGLQRVVDAVNRQGEALASLGSRQIQDLLPELRLQLRSQGLSRPLCIQAFAIIREMAQRTIRQRHFDPQLMGGWALLQGRLAEMETGEGKTLAATLAAATAALAGIPVHVITVNEYLVERDARTMGPLYRALGLSVGYVTQNMALQHRRAAYARDITYGTNKQVAFDYLRDRLVLGNHRGRIRLQMESAYADNHRLGQLLLRGLCFAIVDEADSVLIDEARTPLILSQNVDSTAEHNAYRQALALAKQMRNGVDFFIDPGQRSIQLSLAGQKRLAEIQLPGAGLWQSPRWREELVGRALHALHLLHKDRDYLVREKEVVIIDANTGRTMPDRSWERGLHQLVEAKEGCPLTAAREQLGRLTYQRLFRRYLRLAGMTGTAREVSSELWSVYGLRVQRIPLHSPSRRRELDPLIYPRKEAKWAAVIASVRELRSQGRPVLIGTASVADSESLSQKLTATAIAHRVLNARQDQEEAEIVATAGRHRQVTVATNMAGRGTDIPLADGVAELGGLHVIAACRNDARRIDRQLSGRCARQGDPGSHQAILSLEDDLIRQNCHPTLVHFLHRYAARGRFSSARLNRWAFRWAQHKVERRHRDARRDLLRHERQTVRLLAFSGPME
jgi:preprotein translocase subunit SecA